MVARVLKDEATGKEYIDQALYELWSDLHHSRPLTIEDAQTVIDTAEVLAMNLVVIWRLLEL